MSQRDDRLAQVAERMDFPIEGEIAKGGDYAPVVRDGRHLYVSGQVPRVGTTVVVTGRAGGDVPLERARQAARICALRALVLLQRELGSLDRITAIPKVNVYTQSAQDFTQQSEVADAASALIVEVLGPEAAHARTSIGVFQLPKNATVELDLVATLAGEIANP
jgi:enamine deaminase RidA (YjgF/YER057c/UK114 family)